MTWIVETDELGFYKARNSENGRLKTIHVARDPNQLPQQILAEQSAKFGGKTMNDLTYFNAAKSALIQAKNIDEVKDIRDKAEAMRAYVKQAGDSSEMQNMCAEIKLRAERRLGEMLGETEKNPGGRPTKNLSHDTTGINPTLPEMGITRDQSSRWQSIAQLPEETFEEYLAEKIKAKEEITTADVLRLAKGQPYFMSRNTGDFEWYTPIEIIEAAREVMGTIDLDPASCVVANEVVKAEKFYTEEDDGLKQEWFGNVWMNPPYNQPLLTFFCEKLANSYKDGFVTEAIVLVNNPTDTKWFQNLANDSTAICLTAGRVKYWKPDKTTASHPLQGQAIFYLGNNPEKFADTFSSHGECFVAPRWEHSENHGIFDETIRRVTRGLTGDDRRIDLLSRTYSWISSLGPGCPGQRNCETSTRIGPTF